MMIFKEASWRWCPSHLRIHAADDFSISPAELGHLQCVGSDTPALAFHPQPATRVLCIFHSPGTECLWTVCSTDEASSTFQILQGGIWEEGAPGGTFFKPSADISLNYTIGTSFSQQDCPCFPVLWTRRSELIFLWSVLYNFFWVLICSNSK